MGNNPLGGKDWDGYCFVGGNWYNPTSWSCTDKTVNYQDAVTGSTKSFTCNGWRMEADCIEKQLQTINQEKNNLSNAKSNIANQLYTYDTTGQNQLNNSIANLLNTFYSPSTSHSNTYSNTVNQNQILKAMCSSLTIVPYDCKSKSKFIGSGTTYQNQQNYHKSVLPFGLSNINWGSIPKFFNSLPNLLSLTKQNLNPNLTGDQIADLNKQLAKLDGKFDQWNSFDNDAYNNALSYNQQLTDETVSKLGFAEFGASATCTFAVGYVNACLGAVSGTYSGLKNFVKQHNQKQSYGKDIDYGSILTGGAIDGVVMYGSSKVGGILLGRTGAYLSKTKVGKAVGNALTTGTSNLINKLFGKGSVSTTCAASIKVSVPCGDVIEVKPVGGGIISARASLNNAEARAAAKSLGFAETKQIPKELNPHGELVFKQGNKYISADNTVHNASGAWKVFDSRGNRIGTYVVREGKLVYLKK